MRTFLIYKALRKSGAFFLKIFERWRCYLVLWGNNIEYHNFVSNGVPYISVALGAKCVIGKNLSMNNGPTGNPIGSFDKCTIFVDRKASLKIGKNLGISQAAIVCHLKIDIGDNVKLGGGSCIYDTDFHSLNPMDRINPTTDFLNKITKPVFIGNNVFIGARAIILKGVSIGDNSIVGAGSVVSKPIPPNEIWAGNPAKFIRKL